MAWLRRGLRLHRSLALLLFCALSVHQLRYLLAFGSDTGHALEEHGHGYLSTIVPFVVGGAVALVFLGLILPLALDRQRGGGPGRLAPYSRTALVFAAAILAVFWAQEASEGLLAAGHPSGFAALFSQGGWVAVPLALMFGALAAGASRLLERVEESLLAIGRPLRLTRAPRLLRCRPDGRAPARHLRLSFCHIPRPPPPVVI